MTTQRVFYDHDADLAHLGGLTVGVIGYGIQGRAHALNLRDAGLRVLVGNRSDRYAEAVSRDGFTLRRIAEVAEQSDILLLLIPDQAQADVYDHEIAPHLRQGGLLIFAHGYALRYGTVHPRADLDVAMLAPRMPGEQVRGRFLNGGGVPAFADVAQDATGRAWARVLAVAKAMGFTRVGVLAVPYAVEAELDLFTEQFLVAALVTHVHVAFQVLTKELGLPPVPTLLELYASGELAEVLAMAAQTGIGRVFQQNASPTCQYGIAERFADGDGALSEQAREIMREIRDGTFTQRLDAEGRDNYPKVQQLWSTVNDQQLMAAHEWINAHVKGSP